MADLLHAVDDNRSIEMFGTGTACIVSPIKSIGYLGKKIQIPRSEANSEAGPLTMRVNVTILDIQYGVVEHHFSRIII